MMKLHRRSDYVPPEVPQREEVGAPPAPTAVNSANVLVSYGTHRVRLPIGGMTVGDSRQALSRLINLDESAVAVINGQVVDEDRSLDATVTMLSFVKPASVRGSR